LARTLPRETGSRLSRRRFAPHRPRAHAQGLWLGQTAMSRFRCFNPYQRDLLDITITDTTTCQNDRKP